MSFRQIERAIKVMRAKGGAVIKRRPKKTRLQPKEKKPAVITNPTRPESLWTKARVDDLKQLWSEGLSATQIGVRLACFGHTKDGGRSAVLGKVHRLCLLGRTNLVRLKTGRPRKPKEQRPKLVSKVNKELRRLMATPLPAIRPDDIARVSLAELEARHCKYPVGEPVQGFCGLDRIAGSPYCTGHSHLCFRVADIIPRRQPQKQQNTLEIA